MSDLTETFIQMASEQLAIAKAAYSRGNTGEESAALRACGEAIDAAERQVAHEAAQIMANQDAILAKAKTHPKLFRAVLKAHGMID
ncbi:hypothetical protein [Acidisoma silvae]|uniref:Uncharacterized protein n=1 Tax=Acidisoma silvae TaxID=2802396 RepID=A0A963YWJ9_9PROT|nr:hypothetical protein [Acidisoma silvae]MCB8878449.1 hypothetical protein [Acidisoma silvae]